MEKEFNDSGERRARRYGPWDMLRDVLRAAIDFGQFPTALMAMFAIILIVRMPPQELANIIRDILGGLRDRSILGYVLSVAIAAGWWNHVKSIQQWYNDELRGRDNEINNLKSK